MKLNIIKKIPNCIFITIYKMLYEIIVNDMMLVYNKKLPIYFVKSNSDNITRSIIVFEWGSIYGRPVYINILNRIKKLD